MEPLLMKLNSSELATASEFLSNWLPFLSRDLCPDCTRTLQTRIRNLRPEGENTSDGNHHCEEEEEEEEEEDPHSVGSWKDDTSPPVSAVKMSWADMAAQEEEELQEEDEEEGETRVSSSRDHEVKEDNKAKTELSRDQREQLRLSNITRKKDFISFERVNGKFVNILQGLELHSGVFSAAEQKRIVSFVEDLQEKGKNGQLRARTYTAPQKWMKGKGRVTLQFGCCYNYATDKKGNPPGILKNELVDPLPHLFKVMIKRLVRWNVMPPTCIPDSCIVNIYDEGDCIPPHIDNHEFVRPFCTVSFLSECDILFGTNLKVVDAGVFAGSIAIPLPVGSVLVLNGNGADVAKHCVPSVPTKRISITFRRMDESMRPIGHVPEPDLEGLQPLSFDANKLKKQSPSNHKHSVGKQEHHRADHGDKGKWSAERNVEPRDYAQSRRGPAPANRRRVTNFGNSA